MTEEISGIQAAIDAGRQLGIKVESINGTPTIIVPEGWEVETLFHLRDKPHCIEEIVQHTTADSFVDYWKRYATDNSAIFLNTDSNTFAAVFDYHGSSPDWCQHKAIFALKSTPEWSAWKDNNKKPMTQEEFGRFIEDNLVEIVSPPGGEMLEIALSLQAKTNVDFSRAIRLDNGQTQFQYAEKIEGKAGAQGQLKIPDVFSIGLVLFEGGAPYQVDARFRYRIREGNLTLWYELIRSHKTVEANIADTRIVIEGNMGGIGAFFVGQVVTHATNYP